MTDDVNSDGRLKRCKERKERKKSDYSEKLYIQLKRKPRQNKERTAT
jgi:hypothetical protein